MKAIIFDMDGVIVDSELHWKKSEHSLFNKLVSSWTDKDQARTVGLNVADTHKLLIDEYGLTISYEEFVKKMDEVAIQIYQEKTELLDGFTDLIKKLRTENLKIGLASSSLQNWIDIVLDRFELRKYFDVVVSAEKIDLPGKPAPDIYLYTAKKLNAQPEDCVVIEDAKNGALAAKAAGMYCIGFRNGFNEQQDLSAADIEIHGFKELQLENIIN